MVDPIVRTFANLRTSPLGFATSRLRAPHTGV